MVDPEGPEHAPRYDPDDLHKQTKENFWCEEHNTILNHDGLANRVCTVCLVEDRLNMKQELRLYDADNVDSGVVQVWYNWPFPIPRRGETIVLGDGSWVIRVVRYNLGEGCIEVFAIPP